MKNKNVFYKVVSLNYQTADRHSTIEKLYWKKTTYKNGLNATSHACEALKYGRVLFGKPINKQNNFKLVRVYAEDFQLMCDQNITLGNRFLINQCKIIEEIDVNSIIYDFSDIEMQIALEGCIFTERAVLDNVEKISINDFKNYVRFPHYDNDFISNIIQLYESNTSK